MGGALEDHAIAWGEPIQPAPAVLSVSRLRYAAFVRRANPAFCIAASSTKDG